MANGFMYSANHNVALISMPWAPLETPSIAIGLLKSILLQNNILCQSFYFSNKFYAIVQESYEGPIEYTVEQISGDTLNRSHEWLFSRKAFGEDRGKGDFALRDKFEHLVDCLGLQDWSDYTLIGFSCTFDQTISSLALAKVIKQNFPSIPIAIGGATIDQDLKDEIEKNVPWIDHICVGDGEKAILELVEKEKCFTSYLTEEEFNLLPAPNYDEFYNEYTGNTRYCSIESSRGCWYGNRNLCSFCGMVPKPAYRIKRNFVDEIRYMKSRYGVKCVDFSDLVFPAENIETIVGATGLDTPFSCNLRSDTIKQNELDKFGELHKAGFKKVLIGIESLHSELLKLMRKGHLAINCVSTLKWAKYYGVKIEWFLLFGIPGDRDYFYHQLLKVLKVITHLDCPDIQPIGITKRSPYYHTLGGLTPCDCYKNIYPDYFDLNKIAVTFDIEITEKAKQIGNSRSISKVIEFVQVWKHIGVQHSLVKHKSVVYDNRYGTTLKVELSPTEEDLLDFCYLPQKRDSVHRVFDLTTIGGMVNLGLLLYLDRRYLSLTSPEKKISSYAHEHEGNQLSLSDSQENTAHKIHHVQSRVIPPRLSSTSQP